MKMPSEFAVIDVETTGLFPGGTDRVIEVAAVRMNRDGDVLGQYVTLLNPERDIGATNIHGIAAGDVLNAPRFGDVIGDLVELLDGAVVVGHNVLFDARFVEAEFKRHGHPFPEVSVLCTLRALGGKLEDCCADFGIEANWHSALDDALATGQLFTKLAADEDSDLPSWVTRFGRPGTAWPTIAPSRLSYCRTRASNDRSVRDSYLGQLVSRLPPLAGADVPEAFVVYYELLDRILEDRRIDQHEREQVEALAGEWGLTREQATGAHHAYLSRLATQALADGVLSSAERSDLESVRTLLNIDESVLNALLDAPAQTSDEAAEAGKLSGLSICFTGALTCSVDGRAITRSQAEEWAADAGMVVLRGVTKKLDVLVLADPDSQSGKAAKARSYGTRLMAEPVFWRELGIAVD